MPNIGKILIANRGEIACRIIRTCREMGITTVAVFSEPDANALFVREADEAMALGAVTSSESYLNIDKIIRAARESGANAIHPGYGFLSENADFARAVTAAGLVFIGPNEDTIRKMGSKITAKEIMEKAGVPVIPGYHGRDQSVSHLIKQAKKIGFPLMVKASAGGGGKGLKKVTHERDLKDAIESARREAKAAFGDDTLLIEKFIESPRHIEVQVFGDQHGNIIHLFERECSLQRRHQKVIEEAPSPVVNNHLRERLGKAAVKAASAVPYVGAGTVEFIMDQKGNFYFLEMNTRLQVEHPVTEMITGLNLVKMQIQVAQGLKLPVGQKDITLAGHAMEARVYAEDPVSGFLPATGRIVYLSRCNRPDVRYDFGVTAGDEINTYYDPMIGKIIACAQERSDCIDRLHQALSETTILGTTTNLSFLRDLVNHPAHVAGDFDTDFIDKNLPAILKKSAFDITPYLISAHLCLLHQAQNGSSLPLMQTLTGFRICPAEWIPVSFRVNGKEKSFAYRVASRKKRQYEYSFSCPRGTRGGGEPLDIFTARLLHIKNNNLSLVINDRHYEMVFATTGEAVYLKTPAGSLNIKQSEGLEAARKQVATGSLTAPLPGKVLKVMVKPEQTVAAGQTLMIVEAMKMEHPIKALSPGKVTAIHYRENDTVKLGDVLVEISAQ